MTTINRVIYPSDKMRLKNIHTGEIYPGEIIPAKSLSEADFTEVTEAEYPSDGKSYIDSWTETETEITQIWTELPQTDDDPISDSEALEIITGGADI